MNKELILKIRNQAIDNVSNKRIVNAQIERTWLQDDFDLEFARLLLEPIVQRMLYLRDCSDGQMRDGDEARDVAGEILDRLERG